LNLKNLGVPVGLELLDEIKSKASDLKKTVVLPESHDERVLKAAEILTKDKIVSVILIGNEQIIRNDGERVGIELTGIRIIDPSKSEKLSDFTNIFFNRMADGSVAGSSASTADVLRAGIQCVGMPEGISIVSSVFLMLLPDKTFSYADCAVVPNPDANQLADIAISTADNHLKITDEEANIAMLSFSTKGSAEHELLDKVIEATKIVKEKRPNLNVDGELQFDTAIIDSIGQKKAPGSPVAGKANVLIFPDLNSGNIGYKIAQRLGGADAIGPLVQGLNKPCFDLSRGCSVDDIVNTASFAAVLS
jgi:phosphate acetyltransferase